MTLTAPTSLPWIPSYLHITAQDTVGVLLVVCGTSSHNTGYGHATRVSAFARHLLSLPLTRRLTVHIVSSAPRHVLADSIACGALYRFAEIDPVIVQPLA